MGHSVAIHTEVNRLQTSVLEITKVYRALVALEEGNLANYHSRSMSTIDIDEFPEPQEEEELEWESNDNARETSVAETGETSVADFRETNVGDIGETSYTYFRETNVAETGETGIADFRETNVADTGETSREISVVDKGEVDKHVPRETGESGIADFRETNDGDIGETSHTCFRETNVAKTRETVVADFRETNVADTGETSREISVVDKGEVDKHVPRGICRVRWSGEEETAISTAFKNRFLKKNANTEAIRAAKKEYSCLTDRSEAVIRSKIKNIIL